MEEHRKILISLNQLKECTNLLPNPVGYGKPNVNISIKKHSEPVHFERIKFRDSKGHESAKWSYKGRIIVETSET